MSMYKIGDDIRLKTIVQLDGKTFRLETPDSLPTWEFLLRTRNAALVCSGDDIEGWVFNIHQGNRLIFITTDDFGRLPVSDRMRPRYIRAMRHVLSLVNVIEPCTLDDISQELVSEAKGMLSRCLRKDQWDWYSVYQCLGRPSMPYLAESRDALIQLRLASKSRDVEAIAKIWRRLLTFDLQTRFSVAIDFLVKEAPRLQASKVFFPYNSGYDNDKNSIEVADQDRYVLSVTSHRKLERANEQHEEVLNLLAAYLKTRGYLPESNQFIDLFARLEAYPAIYEVKSVTEHNWRAQIRKAVSQLYEYRYLYDLYEARLFLVLSAPPPEQWIMNYLQKDRDIGCLWRDGDNFDGPGVTAAFGTGSLGVKPL